MIKCNNKTFYELKIKLNFFCLNFSNFLIKDKKYEVYQNISLIFKKADYILLFYKKFESIIYFFITMTL